MAEDGTQQGCATVGLWLPSQSCGVGGTWALENNCPGKQTVRAWWQQSSFSFGSVDWGVCCFCFFLYLRWDSGPWMCWASPMPLSHAPSLSLGFSRQGLYHWVIATAFGLQRKVLPVYPRLTLNSSPSSCLAIQGSDLSHHICHSCVFSYSWIELFRTLLTFSYLSTIFLSYHVHIWWLVTLRSTPWHLSRMDPVRISDVLSWLDVVT